MRKLFKGLSLLNLNTIRFNFKYLPVRQAVKLPILVSRHCYLRKTCGEVSIEGDIRTGMIRIGLDSIGIFDDRKSRSIWQVAGRVVFKGSAFIGHGSKICVGEQGELVFGDNFTITAESSVVATKRITFGDGCLLSWDILIMDTDWHKIVDSSGEQINVSCPIAIGNNVWIGCRSTLMKGTSIPDGCVISAGSYCSKSFDSPNCIIGKNPLQIIKSDIRWIP